MFNTIVVEVTGLKKTEQRNYVDPLKTKVTYEAELKDPNVIGGFFASVKFDDAADAPRIGDRFTLTLTPIQESDSVPAVDPIGVPVGSAESLVGD